MFRRRAAAATALRDAPMGISSLGLACFATQYLGYVALSTCIESAWYARDQRRERGDAKEKDATSKSSSKIIPGKIQPKSAVCGTVRARPEDPWGFPLYQMIFRRFPREDGRTTHPRHRAYASWNLFASSLFALAVGESVARNRSSVYSSDAPRAWCEWSGVLDAVLGFAAATCWQSVLEYYWHRAMHWRWFYERLHKIHHFYVSPCAWCDLCIHPIEAFGYYCILYSPAWALRMRDTSFVAYMILMGVCGVLDHCGIALKSFGSIYETSFHDAHHRTFFFNYAFPFDIMDRACGTLWRDGATRRL